MILTESLLPSVPDGHNSDYRYLWLAGTVTTALTSVMVAWVAAAVEPVPAWAVAGYAVVVVALGVWAAYRDPAVPVGPSE